jgi:hypothetical protein
MPPGLRHRFWLESSHCAWRDPLPRLRLRRCERHDKGARSTPGAERHHVATPATAREARARGHHEAEPRYRAMRLTEGTPGTATSGEEI